MHRVQRIAISTRKKARVLFTMRNRVSQLRSDHSEQHREITENYFFARHAYVSMTRIFRSTRYRPHGVTSEDTKTHIFTETQTTVVRARDSSSGSSNEAISTVRKKYRQLIYREGAWVSA